MPTSAVVDSSGMSVSNEVELDVVLEKGLQSGEDKREAFSRRADLRRNLMLFSP
jgi:hypothetical protein